mgnify:CR=1 FL=1
MTPLTAAAVAGVGTPDAIDQVRRLGARPTADAMGAPMAVEAPLAECAIRAVFAVLAPEARAVAIGWQVPA